MVFASGPFVAALLVGASHCACRYAATRRARTRSESLDCRFCWHPKPRVLQSTDAQPIPQMQMCAPVGAGQTVEMAVMPVSLSLRPNEPPGHILARAPMLPLPPGWEQCADAHGQIYLHPSSGTTTWIDPRLAPARYDSALSAATLPRAAVEGDLARPSPAVACAQPPTGPAAPALSDGLRCFAAEDLRAAPSPAHCERSESEAELASPPVRARSLNRPQRKAKRLTASPTAHDDPARELESVAIKLPGFPGNRSDDAALPPPENLILSSAAVAKPFFQDNRARADAPANTGLAPIQKLPDGWRHQMDPDGRCSALSAHPPRD